ncbi:MAG TPA: hypothetical protein VKH46_08380, partial [Thermoanaerobaculia bacterium]|nr:hypothetical protein [Thermoanaerobaculia bacterium]
MNHEAQSRFSVRAVAIVLASFAFATVFCVNLFPHYRNPNELSRFDLVVSIVDRGSLSIGPELAKFGYHEDRSVFRGEFFSNKAPGLSFAAVPAYALIRLFTGPASETTLVPILFVIRLLTVSSVGVFALLVFSRRLRRSRMDPRWIPSVVFALAFGTPWLVYSRSFFSHAWTAALLYLAFECLHRPEEKPWHPALAGFLAGWAVLSEYPAAIVAMLLLFDATWR